MVVAMTGANYALLADWKDYCCRRAGFDDSETVFDLELGVIAKVPRRVDSCISLKTLKPANECCKASNPVDAGVPKPILLTFNLNNEVYTKSLDYGTFAHWGAMAGLLADIEEDGLVPGNLWDALEDMKVYSGDWDARVYQGWEIHLHCRDEAYWSETDTDEGSDVDEAEVIEEIVAYYEDFTETTEDWCLPRWRGRVEQGRQIREQVREPSWEVLALGCVSMLFFIVTVVLYTV
jgi:hypothetical protein